MTPSHPPTPEPAQPSTLPGRLWFHLDDVLPLAAHAVSTRRHAITAAGLLAGAPLLPAFAWQSNTAGDVLSSNGVPGWYDSRGREHTARARRWKRTGADRATAGTTWGFLPLTGPSGLVPVVDWLHQAADRGRTGSASAPPTARSSARTSSTSATSTASPTHPTAPG